MQRSASTVVCLVGAVTPALQPVLGAHTTYLLHDDDPLGPVADAWVHLFEAGGPIGELEVAATETVARWRAGTLELPDYYFVVDADALTDTRRYWYFGVLHEAAPSRVVPVDAGTGAVLAALESLASGPWWPRVDRLLDGIEHRAPVGRPLHADPTAADDAPAVILPGS